MSLLLSLAPKIASYAIPPPSRPSTQSGAIELSQARHRIHLLNIWNRIQPESRVLELGCGQGTCTAVRAVLSEDPGLAKKKWDVAVLAHCIWYFRSVKEVTDILVALKERVDRMLVAEYAMRASEMAAVPHVLATVARAALKAHLARSSANIQTPLSPVAIKDLAAEVGWKVEMEEVMVSEPELSDGLWETASVVNPGFLKEIEEDTQHERVRVMLKAARDAVVAATDGVGGVEKVRTMDAWVATFGLRDR